MARNQRKYNPVGCFFFWENCLVSKRMFIPDVTPFFLSFKTLYIDTKKVINTGYSCLLCDQR